MEEPGLFSILKEGDGGLTKKGLDKYKRELHFLSSFLYNNRKKITNLIFTLSNYY